MTLPTFCSRESGDEVLARRPDPRILLLFGGVSVIAAASGPVPAVGVLISSLCVAAMAGLSWRPLLPVVSSFGFFVLLIPFAAVPAAVAILKGLAISLAITVAVVSARWDRALAVFQALGAGRQLVAFLSIALAHVEGTGRDARRAAEALKLRGGFRGLRGVAASTPVLLARTLSGALLRATRTADALTLRGYTGLIPGLPRFRPALSDAVPLAATLLAVLLAAGHHLQWNR